MERRTGCRGRGAGTAAAAEVLKSVLTAAGTAHRMVLYDTIMTSFLPARMAAIAVSRLPPTQVTTLREPAGKVFDTQA